MADPAKKVSDSIPGEFFVDTTCIDCDTCRQLAPQTFKDNGDYSVVYHQPEGETEIRKATQALLACPTGSIGTLGSNDAKKAMIEFPLPIEENVFYCGFNSPKSYGANSYFIEHPDGNWLIDSPKYLPHLVKQFQERGGLKYIFLTHEDDVADSQKYAEAFNAQRIIHQAALDKNETAEIILEGEADHFFGEDFCVIPTPGHTQGHCVLLYKNRFLFTGDHLCWSREKQGLHAFKRHCWYSLERLRESLAKLKNYSFEWVLPGHGQRVHLPTSDMQEKLQELVAAF